jgi:competence protein ComEA
VRALAAVAVLVVVGAAALAWWSRPRPEPLAPQPPVAVAATLPPSGPAELVVAVTGLVREPGLVRLPPGARVADAIEAAGGVLPDADVSYLNLARKLADGELVAVGIPPPPGAVGPAGPGSTGGKVDLNLATQAELETLPGVGPALAGRIIDYRTEHGRFRSITELREVSGIGEVRFAELRDLVTV